MIKYKFLETNPYDVTKGTDESHVSGNTPSQVLLLLSGTAMFLLH